MNKILPSIVVILLTVLFLKHSFMVGNSFVLLIVGISGICFYWQRSKISEEDKERHLNQKFPETVHTFESFLKCKSKSNPSIFHRCPRPYDDRYDETQDLCIYCGEEG